MSHGTEPTIPTSLTPYDSYVEDPKWQRRFTIVWTSALAVYVVFNLSRRLKQRRDRRSSRSHPISFNRLRNLCSIFWWSLPGFDVNLGQALIVLVYVVVVIVCMVDGAPLRSNSNRAGFMAIAQLTPVFLFATKNSPLALLFGISYDKVNFLHRWTSRSLFLCVLVHGSLWINNRIQYNLPILGQQKETSGIAAFGVLGGLVLTSLRPVRRWFYNSVFWTAHVFGFPAFFITICYHTPYAPPWIYPPLALYALDLTLRLFRYRIEQVVLETVDAQMTLIHMPFYTPSTPSRAGEFLRIHLFIPGRIFESHPLTIMPAPAGQTGVVLGARAAGDWSRAVQKYAESRASPTEKGRKTVPLLALVDGPYGGLPSLDAVDDGADVFLISGGSGVTYCVAVLASLLQRSHRGRRVEFVWCVRSFGHIKWLATQLASLATTAADASVDLRILICVTCLCDPDAVPDIPQCEVVELKARPETAILLRDFVSSHAGTDPELASTDSKRAPANSKDLDKSKNVTGSRPVIESKPVVSTTESRSLAVFASGPESLTLEAGNAAAALALSSSGKLDIKLFTEVFSL
ncbi:hypothetical protein FISHEDRAFT_66860 [Fistulina hepatica ATCC 64428]|uniref:FAD-binding FR-type domain-containing protein n=1 Tax=Fistulina hepatica ATCC 64428 TaxID=1128425 RepID=A0A0D7A427_9AGAR|nr:hypothetical protein FISHEDRAFT_66860 [Fistulina hepatica ATCC 64428]